MRNGMKFAGALLMFCGTTLGTANAHVAQVSNAPIAIENVSAPTGNWQQGHIIRREERDLEINRQELQRQNVIANELRERINSDRRIGDRRAERFDKERLRKTNHLIDRLRRDIERDERVLRHVMTGQRY